jgi:hypothetical protein
MNNKLLALYGLKWSPFSPQVPTEALYVSPRVESFCWRVEQLASEGGFGLVSGYEKEFVMGSTVAHTVDFHDLRASSAFDYFVGSSQRVKPCQQLRIPFPARPPSRSCRHIDLFKGLALCVDIRTCIKIRCIQTFMT